MTGVYESHPPPWHYINPKIVSIEVTQNSLSLILHLDFSQMSQKNSEFSDSRSTSCMIVYRCLQIVYSNLQLIQVDSTSQLPHKKTRMDWIRIHCPIWTPWIMGIISVARSKNPQVNCPWKSHENPTLQPNIRLDAFLSSPWVAVRQNCR